MALQLGNLLGDTLRRAKILPEVQAVLIMKDFSQIASRIWGQTAQTDFMPQYLKNSKLIVKVRSSAYAQEIKLREKEIITEINKLSGRQVVTAIRCLV